MDNETLRMLAETSERSKSNSARIKVVEKKVDDLQELTKTVAVMADRMGNMSTDIKGIKTIVENVKDRPVNNIKKVIWLVVGALATSVVSVCVGLLMSRLVG